VRAPEFALLRHRGGERSVDGPAVVVCTAGSLQVGDLDLASGHAAFVPAYATATPLRGSGEGYLATVGQAG
jgi:mannose-6-phosphate isomerase